MARWLRKDEHEPPAELLDFTPSDWVLGGDSSPERLRMALSRWYSARWQWVLEDPSKRTIDGLDVIEVLFEAD